MIRRFLAGRRLQPAPRSTSASPQQSRVRPTAIGAVVLVLAALVSVSRAADDAPSRASSAGEFYLKGGEKIVFFGDSITQSGQYVEYVETFLRTRFPDRSFQIVNRGISSETISGTSELDHEPRRPHAHVRFVRDVVSERPDVLVACFGMNDGNYHPFDEERFAAYQAGVQKLIERSRSDIGCRLTLLTPPPYDPYRRKAGDPEAVAFGYKFPAVDYDRTLAAYSRWLMTIDSPGVLTIDLHTPMNQHLETRRREKVSFFLAGDAVHPNPTGHWLMAQHLLLGWQAPAVASEAVVDAGERRALAGAVEQIARNGDAYRFLWKAGLPMPYDPQWDLESIALEQVGRRLNRAQLVVRNLPARQYELKADGQGLGAFTAEQLAAGVDTLPLTAFPPNQRAQQVLQTVQQRSRFIYSQWRQRLIPQGQLDPARDEKIAAWDRKLAELCQPAAVLIELKPVAGEPTSAGEKPQPRAVPPVPEQPAEKAGDKPAAGAARPSPPARTISTPPSATR